MVLYLIFKYRKCCFLVRHVFQKCAKNDQNLPKFEKRVTNNQNDTKHLPVLSFCAPITKLFVSKRSFFEVPQNAKNARVTWCGYLQACGCDRLAVVFHCRSFDAAPKPNPSASMWAEMRSAAVPWKYTIPAASAFPTRPLALCSVRWRCIFLRENNILTLKGNTSPAIRWVKADYWWI